MKSFVFAAPLIPLISVLILSIFVFELPITDAFFSGNARRIDNLHPMKGLSSKDIGSEELSLGAPRRRPQSREYTTLGGVEVNAAVNDIQNPTQTIERKGRETCTAMAKKVGDDHTDVSRKQGNGR